MLNVKTRNSSGDEIANMNFLYDNIVHAVQNTIDSCRNSATDRRSYVLECRFTKFSEITQCNGRYAIQGHSRSNVTYVLLLLILSLFFVFSKSWTNCLADTTSASTRSRWRHCWRSSRLKTHSGCPLRVKNSECLDSSVNCRTRSTTLLMDSWSKLDVSGIDKKSNIP